MNKKTFFAALALAAASPALAQTEQATQRGDVTKTVEYNEGKHSFWDNCFVSASGGVQVYFSDHDRQARFGDRLAPALDIAVGKWFNRWAGLRLMYSGLQLKGATQNGAHSTGKDLAGKPQAGYWLEHQKFNTYHIHADALFNVTNLIWGENKGRIYDCSPYAGIGLIGTGDAPSKTCVAGDFGLYNTFRLATNWAINLDLRATVTSDKLDGEEGGRIEGILGLTVGVTYTFR